MTIVAWLSPMGVREAYGQWVAPGELRNVPVYEDCGMTRHGVGASIQPNLVYPRGAIFLCPGREREIDRRHPGASRFFLVHEYGHLALHTREEAVADEWAAKQLGPIPAERGTLRSALMHFVEQGRTFDPLYGTGLDRGLRVARAARLPPKEWPAELVAYAKSEAAKSASRTTLTLQMGEGYANVAQMTIVLDRKPIGFLSNVDEIKTLQLPALPPGRHLLQAEQVWIYHVEAGAPKAEIARGLRAETEFEPGGKRLAVTFRFDGESLEIRVVPNRYPPEGFPSPNWPKSSVKYILKGRSRLASWPNGCATPPGNRDSLIEAFPPRLG
jgi:hypothetical protein